MTRLFRCALFILGAMLPAAAWDAGGHQVVATIALAHLNPKARLAVEQFAAQVENPERKYDAVTLSCWMDDIRRVEAMPYHGMFLSWHYIDIPIDSRDPMPPLVPGADTEAHGNIAQALKRAIAVLKGGTDPYIKSPAIACALVMHLVGDIHQPLHCATKYFFSHGALRDDHGGNSEDVMNGPGLDPKFNLHAFWDAAWRESFDATSGDVALDTGVQQGFVPDPEKIRALAKTLDQPLAPDAKLEPDIDGWAWESNAIARKFVYPELTSTENKKYCRLSSAYVAKSRTIAQERLVLAGRRLAVLLNETLGQ